MKPGLHIKRDHTRQLAKWMATASQGGVLVGIPGDSTSRAGDDLTNAQLGYIHENGAPEVNLPERPFLIPGVKDVKDKIAEKMKQAALARSKGDNVRAERYLHAAGFIAETSVKRRIQTGPFVPLKASTVRRRRARGRTGTRPLIDTGQLRNSITHIIR